nr:type IV toxin-antitoxin system AbiEi family antitoxin domain-containing protein [Thalassoglobus neptunius]
MNKRQQILGMLRESGVLRPRDVEEAGISASYLNRMYAEGLIDRPSRGLYCLLDSEPGEHRSLAEAAKLIPHGVICLLSALHFHELTTEFPFEVWIALDNHARQPAVDSPPIRVARFSGPALTFGIEEHQIDGVAVRIYTPAKTVADCFKFRNKIGLDVAIEALRDCLREKRATRDEIWKAAQVCRMTNVMRPYLESLS